VTPSFRVHYHEGTAALAVEMAAVAEGALPELVRILGHAPRTPIHVVLSDDMDSPQGFAESAPENVITLFPAVPPASSELGDFDDAMRLLLIHELAHIVHLDTIGGIPAAFNAIFGKQWTPSSVQPRWVVEGIAVNLESELTSGGRVRSSFVDMVVRTQILAGSFPPIDELSNVNRRFLFGTFPWILGGRFIDFIGRTYGEDAIAEMSRAYGTRPVPYALNLTAATVTRRSMVELHAEWEASERRRAEETLARARREGIRIGARIERPSPVVTSPRFARTGELAFVEEPRDGDQELVVLGASLDRELLRVRTSAGQPSLSPDGRRVVAVLSDVHERSYGFTDLEVIDVATGERRRRTRGARLSEPDVSPDGRTIAAVQQAAGRTWIVSLTVGGSDGPKRIFTPMDGEQVGTPRWSPDGRQIALSLKRRSGARNLALLDVGSGELRAVTTGTAHDVDPIWSADRRTIYFGSDRGGVPNVYALDLATEAIGKVTNVETGAFGPALDPSGSEVVFALHHVGGYELHRISAAARSAPGDPLVRPVASASVAAAAYPVERYSAWESLIPKAWLPALGEDGVGMTVGAAVSGADALRQHIYSFQAHYGIESERLGYAVSYTNAMLSTPITIGSSLVATTRPGSFASAGDRLESIWRFSAGAAFPFGRWDGGHSIAVGYAGELRRGLRLPSDDPYQPAPPLDPDLTLSSVSLGWTFSNVRSFAESISPAAGHAIGIGVQLFDPVIGSDLRVLEVVGRWSAYVTMPYLEHHVLALRVSAGGSAGDSRGRSAFVLGGLPVRNVLSDVVSGIGVSSDVIRGYPEAAFRGASFYLVNVEYRLPLWVIAAGVDTIPFFLDRLYAVVFVDAGATPTGTITIEDTKAGVGAEVRLDLDLGYVLGYTLRLGYGRGLMSGGTNNLYLALGGSF
jgi:uncharacterized protein GlcG (DUF336 family)